MRLIGLAVVLALSLTISPLAEAQTVGKVYRVGLIAITPVARIMSDPTHPFNSGFRQEMRDRGYVEGQNFIWELRSLMNLANQSDGKSPDFTRAGPVTHLYETH